MGGRERRVGLWAVKRARRNLPNRLARNRFSCGINLRAKSNGFQMVQRVRYAQVLRFAQAKEDNYSSS